MAIHVVVQKMHPAGVEPATCNLEGCCSVPTELRMLTIGLEPILPKGTDFKSVVFTDFTKRAGFLRQPTFIDLLQLESSRPSTTANQYTTTNPAGFRHSVSVLMPGEAGHGSTKYLVLTFEVLTGHAQLGIGPYVIAIPFVMVQTPAPGLPVFYSYPEQSLPVMFCSR